MSIIEAILVSSEPVKGHASKTKWRQSSLAFTRDSSFFSAKVITLILRRFFVTLYIERKTKLSMRVYACSLTLSYSLQLITST